MPMNYTILAYLPGDKKLAALDSKGQVGWIDDTLRFHPMFSTFVDAAVHKYGYKRISPQVVSQEQLPALLATLE